MSANLPRVAIWDPDDLWRHIHSGFESRLPLRGLQVRSRSNSYREVEPLSLDIVDGMHPGGLLDFVAANNAPLKPVSASFGKGATAHLGFHMSSPGNWYQVPHVYIYVLKCEDFDVYKEESKKIIAGFQEAMLVARNARRVPFLNASAEEKKSMQEEYAQFFEYEFIVLYVPLGTRSSLLSGGGRAYKYVLSALLLSSVHVRSPELDS